MIVSIDGPAGSGKSTIAKILSEKLGFIHFNSGSLYRAVAVYLKSTNFNFSALTDDCEIGKLKIEIKYIKGNMAVSVNKMDCTPFLRNNDISILSPKVSTNKCIRTMIDDCQHKFGKTHNLVVDGRDIGSYVFPDANFKFYLDCSLEERARRRLKEEKLKGNKISLKEIKAQMQARDEIDRHKKYAPLVVPKNAIIIDSTNLSIDEVVGAMLNAMKK